MMALNVFIVSEGESTKEALPCSSDGGEGNMCFLAVPEGGSGTPWKVKKPYFVQSHSVYYLTF